MLTLRSYVEDSWVTGQGARTPLFNPATEEVVAEAGTGGVDFRAALEHARRVGGPALRELTFAQRGDLLRAISRLIHANRDALIEPAIENGGNTRSDAKFDIDGAAGTLAAYAEVGAQLGAVRQLEDGVAVQLGRSARWFGQHILVPREGVAVHVNAFNFPAWGFAEKAALRATPSLHRGSVRVNVEADSLNAAVLAPDAERGSPTWDLFLADVTKEMTQKAGQKCTAFRRLLVPDALVDAAAGDLSDRLAQVKVGDPAHEAVTMGPLSTASQLREVREGLMRLRAEAEPVFGGDGTVTPIGAPAGNGWFVGAVLLQCNEPGAAEAVHTEEVFGPVATLCVYDGSAHAAARLVSRGGGMLQASVYGDDRGWLAEAVRGIAPWVGRIYLGNAKISDQRLSPGTVLPQLIHGGPGRAGGGEELGGARGLALYLQRVALQGDKAIVGTLLHHG